MNSITAPWIWFALFWVVGLAWLTHWHILAYARVSFAAIHSGIPNTLSGSVVAVALSAAIVRFSDLHNPFLILLLVYFGVSFAQYTSCRLQELPERRADRKADRELELEVRRAGGMEAYLEKKRATYREQQLREPPLETKWVRRTTVQD